VSAHCRRSAAMLQEFPEAMETETRCGRVRRTREFDQRRHTLPVAMLEGGWRRRRPRVSSTCSFRCELEQGKDMSGCTGERERV
jgi:hypothetical protein